jgi:hypothetical protein
MKKSNGSYDVIDMLNFIKKVDKGVLINLLAYIKEKNYEGDIVVYFLEIFKDAYFYDHLHRNQDPSITDINTYLNGIIDILNKTNIKFVRDINESTYFKDNLIKIKYAGQYNMGYSKNREGQYIIDTEHPTHFPGRKGNTTICDKNIEILYDDVTKSRPTSLKITLSHEVTHIKHEKFDIYQYIMNIVEFINILLEGNAMSESQRVTSTIFDVAYIPFPFNKKNNNFQTTKAIYSNIEYDVYAYLYFKLKFLLGTNFINEWTTGEDSKLKLFEACELIDKEYGVGSFNKLYKNIELILLGYKKSTKSQLKGEINYWKDKLQNICEGVAQVETSDNKRELEIIKALNDESFFESIYNIKKETLQSLKRIYESMNEPALVKKYEQQLSNHTKEKFKTRLLYELSDLKKQKQKQLYENPSFFKNIASMNIDICEFALSNSNYLNLAIYELESFMLDCIESNIINHGDLDDKISNYYMNVINDQFNHDIFKKLKDRAKNLVQLSKKKNY